MIGKTRARRLIPSFEKRSNRIRCQKLVFLARSAHACVAFHHGVAALAISKYSTVRFLKPFYSSQIPLHSVGDVATPKTKQYSLVSHTSHPSLRVDNAMKGVGADNKGSCRPLAPLNGI